MDGHGQVRKGFEGCLVHRAGFEAPSGALKALGERTVFILVTRHAQEPTNLLGTRLRLSDRL